MGMILFLRKYYLKTKVIENKQMVTNCIISFKNHLPRKLNE